MNYQSRYPELSDDAVASLRWRINRGWFLGPALMVIFGTMTTVYNAAIGVASLGIGAASALATLLYRDQAFRYPTAYMLVALAGLAYWHLSSILLGFAAFSVVAPPDLVLLLAVVYGAALICAYGIYYPRYGAGWEKKRRYNETKVLNLERGTYEAANGFQLDMPDAGPIEATLYRIVLPFAPIIFVGGFVLRRVGLDALDKLFGTSLALWFGILSVQMVIQPWIHYQKLLGYERRIGRRITNR